MADMLCSVTGSGLAADTTDVDDFGLLSESPLSKELQNDNHDLLSQERKAFDIELNALESKLDQGSESTCTVYLNRDQLDKNGVVRKSQRPKKPPKLFTKTAAVALAVERSKKKKKPVKPGKLVGRPASGYGQNSKFPDFKCDLCGSRYVVNPLRRASKLKMVSYEPFPRHKVDPVTQKILTLCNACGLSFGREKKVKAEKVVVTEEQRQKFHEEGEAFGKELAAKLEDELASKLFCSHFKSVPCGCIQKFICKDEQTSIEELLQRATDLMEVMQTAGRLKALKCYDSTLVQRSKKHAMIGLGNGHRRSQQYEDFVLAKRQHLRKELKLCEKAVQKMLLYSNNFLHKRMKTDPSKPIRIERQKGKAAMGNLRSIEELPFEACCVDNCVRMALTHGRLLEQWRSRATSGQVEARRVLAEMLTPSGGNRANCYRFISWVTGCSSSTIGKVNSQMKTTCGDREPPEHGLKKYWKGQREARAQTSFTVDSYKISPHGILQQAVNLSGLSSISPDSLSHMTQSPPFKKKRRQKQSDKPSRPPCFSAAIENATMELLQSGNANTGEVHTNVSSNPQSATSTLLSLNGSFPSQAFITIPPPLATASTITLPAGLSLQTIQQQLQQQQQLQLQIQLLQQQLHSSSQASQVVAEQARMSGGQTSDFIVTVAETSEQAVLPDAVVPISLQQAVATCPSLVIGDVSCGLPSMNVAVNSGLGAINVASADTVLHRVVSNTHNLLVMQDSVNLLAPQSFGAKSVAVGTTVSVLSAAGNKPMNSFQPVTIIKGPSPVMAAMSQPTNSLQPVTIITSPLPTMASISQPVTISLQSSALPISNLSAMIVTQPITDQHEALLTSLGSTVSLVPSQAVATLKTVGSYGLAVKANGEYAYTDHNVAASTAAVVSAFNADSFLTSDSSYSVLASVPVSQMQQRQLGHQTGMEVSFSVS